MILIGAGSAAVSIELFLVPNNFIDGGIIGVSLILDHLFMSNPSSISPYSLCYSTFHL